MNRALVLADAITPLFDIHKTMLMNKTYLDKTLQGAVLKSLVKNHKILYEIEQDKKLKKRVLKYLQERIGAVTINKILKNLEIKED